MNMNPTVIPHKHHPEQNRGEDGVGEGVVVIGVGAGVGAGNTIPEAKAGSIFNLFIDKGIIIPTKQAKPKLISIAKEIAKAKIRLSNQ